MIIKPSKAYKVLWFCALISIPIVLVFLADDIFRKTLLSVWAVAILIAAFTKAFSVYTINQNGIEQKCICWSRRIDWEAFKYIGVQRLTKGGGLGATPSYFIRCSTVALPKAMTGDEFEKKLYWRPSTTITIPWPDKNGEEFYREFLSYCGGERDIRE